MIEELPSLRTAHAAVLPPIIQGGMGVGVSGWRLARAVSGQGQLGVVSGTALDLLLTRQLQLGDPDGHLRRALAAFPYPEIAARILDRYFICRRQGRRRAVQNAADDFPRTGPADARVGRRLRVSWPSISPRKVMPEWSA